MYVCIIIFKLTSILCQDADKSYRDTKKICLSVCLTAVVS